MKHIGAVFFILTCSFCFSQQRTLSNFHWLEGTWKQDGKEIYEKWVVVNDTQMNGTGFHFMFKEEEGELEKEFRFDEHLQLIQRHKSVVYIASVLGQNNSLPTEFPLTSVSNNSFVADSPEHDFPQRIIYTLTDSGRLHAQIEGRKNGKQEKVDFYFTREN